MTATVLLTRSELREASRSRWLIVAAGGFALLSAALTFAGSAGGSAGFGPTAAGLINVELIAVPLFALVLGAMAFARDRERGTYAYLRALPLSLWQLYCSKLCAISLEITAVVFAGFAGAFGAMTALGVGGGDIGGAVQFALLTWLLGLTCGMIGVFISACAKRSPAALGAAVACWLLFVIFGDLGIMATSLATHMGLGMLVTLTSMNPIEAYKIASLAALSGSVDVLGPGGRLAADLFGAAIMPVMVGVLILWAGLAKIGGWLVLSRRRDA